MARTKLKPHIRWLTRADMDAVTDMEWYTPDPTPARDLIELLRQRNCVGMVADTEHPQCVVGYMVFEIFKTSFTLARLVVSPNHRGLGVGRALVAKMTGKLTASRPHLRCVVRETNEQFMLFLRHMGFECRGWYRDYYAGEEAVIMEYRAES